MSPLRLPACWIVFAVGGRARPLRVKVRVYMRCGGQDQPGQRGVIIITYNVGLHRHGPSQQVPPRGARWQLCRRQVRPRPPRTSTNTLTQGPLPDAPKETSSHIVHSIASSLHCRDPFLGPQQPHHSHFTSTAQSFRQ